ncbi:MAG TPA: hypothetical protein VJ828_14720 [Lacipirellulaceae bacterium]|nr:hypothetical protein [Lacipirellulaceae bacterium]
MPPLEFVLIWTVQLALGVACVSLALFEKRRLRLLRFLADVSLLYPCIVVFLLYSQWILSWYMLGHRPEWSTDDPKYINGASWMHLINLIVLVGILPIIFGAVAFNVMHILRNRTSAAQASIRIATLVSLWLGLLIWMNRDPHGIIEWWLD